MGKLLEKVHQMRSGLISAFRGSVDFSLNATALGSALGARVYITGKNGELLGYDKQTVNSCPCLNDLNRTRARLPENVNRELLQTKSNKVYQGADLDGCLFQTDGKCPLAYRVGLALPILTGEKEDKERIGTLILLRKDNPFNNDDLVVIELFLAITAVELMHRRLDALQEQERKESSIRSVIESLSFSELLAIKRVLQEIGNENGFIVANKIAGELQFAAAVVSSALRKLEGAAVIETRSRGVKGMYVRVINDCLVKEVAKASVG